MIWDFWRKKGVHEAGELARRQHSQWLTMVLGSAKPVPRIPVRRVDDGGFGRQMQRKMGPPHAELWWKLALERTPGDSAE